MSKDGKLLLLDFWASPFCARVKIALEEKGQKYEQSEENLFGGKSELLLKSNPIHKKVPVIFHNGKPILESSIIVEYIDETWPSPPLLPSCPYEKAQAKFWADYIDKKVFEVGGNIWRNTSGEVQEEAVKEFIEILKQLEEALGDKDFFGGKAFGYVDILAIPLTSWFLAFEKFGGFKVEDHVPKFSAWIKRCLQRETVSKVYPDPEKVYEFVGNFRKMNGIE
ncbi:putative glutathione S-transferase [Morus notabilis]|uniref:glutathione transferase n=1 Tax=Morus notabilis TaxID=981085 RepID=W9RC75_9ROSA|nr:probable glutathione S-transferase [Morus notabilis]EXB81775.1 putative glutathione S-transferase [Morus notabilis]